MLCTYIVIYFYLACSRFSVLPETTLDKGIITLFSYSPFQIKQGRLILPHSLPFTVEFDMTLTCSIKRGYFCLVWSNSLDQLQQLSIQEKVIVQNKTTLKSPITVIIFNLQDKYDFYVSIIYSIILIDHHTSSAIDSPTYHSSSFPLLAEDQTIHKLSALLSKQELFILVNVFLFNSVS